MSGVHCINKNTERRTAKNAGRKKNKKTKENGKKKKKTTEGKSNDEITREKSSEEHREKREQGREKSFDVKHELWQLVHSHLMLEGREPVGKLLGSTCKSDVCILLVLALCGL